MKAIRILLAVLAAALLLYALFAERHAVRIAGTETVLEYTGPEFTAGASVDRFLRGGDGRLYDRRSLAASIATPQPVPHPALDGTAPPETSGPVEETFGKEIDIEEDCPT
ncbi:MAG: hypothetical protein ACOCX4_10890 [Planctomycetota bacterium]